MKQITLHPIGVVRTPYHDTADTPRQPGMDLASAIGTIHLIPGRNFEQALQDLAGFEHIWVLTWFDRVRGWKPKVLPPRGRTKHGVLATRSPHRPNPIGLSLCRLLKVRGRTLTIENPDLLDGTPVLDLKPYLPYVEAFPESRVGWVADQETDPAALFVVRRSSLAMEQLTWLLDTHGIDLTPRLHRVLSTDPFPHPYRRIRQQEDGTHILAIKSWRIVFRIRDHKIIVDRVLSGYRPNALKQAPDAAIHRAFLRRWNPDDAKESPEE